MNDALPAFTVASDRRAEINHHERRLADIVGELEMVVSELADDLEPLPDSLVRDSMYLARNHVARARQQALIARIYLNGALEAHTTNH